MTQHFDALAAPPPAEGLTSREQELLAYELIVVGRGARERAELLKATGHRGVELAVVELTELARRVLARAHRYQHSERTHPAAAAGPAASAGGRPHPSPAPMAQEAQPHPNPGGTRTMNTNQVTLTAEPPAYAPDGSRGYALSVTREGGVSGWIHVGDDGRTVFATIDRAEWRRVGTVDSPAELTISWITDHADVILRAF